MANATWLADVLRRAGLKVAEQPGWLARGHAQMGVIRGVMLHHTAGARTGNMGSLGVVTNGRPGLSGPLCNLALGRDGTWYVVAAGLAYHAGAGLWQGVANGNGQMIGVEAENTGLANDQPWPEVQVDAYARGCAAILTHIGAAPIMACGHKEYGLPKGRKIDPTFDMPAFRLRVAGIMGGAIVRPPIPAKDAQARPTLRRGATGDLVVLIQQAVAARPADGDFGPATEAAVRAYQRGRGLVADGIVGPSTWAAIDHPKLAA